jgi:hypothetical protein
MKRLRVVAIIAVSSAAMLLVGLGSRMPYRAAHHEAALLRLSWRIRGEHSEQCRDRTQAELDALPAHMRVARV